MKEIDYHAAVASQPRMLELSLAAASDALATAALAPWHPGDTVAVVGMGASSHSAHALVSALGAVGVRAVSMTASDVALLAPGHQPADHYVLVSESGRSPEPVDAARRFTAGRRIAVTNVPGSPLTEVADVVVPLGGFDDGAVYTIGYTATLLAYSLLMRRAGLPGHDIAAGLGQRVEAALTRCDGAARIVAAHLLGAQAVDFVGRGMSLAAASEGALIIREALAMPAAAFDSYQYLHGPLEGLRPGGVLVVFGDAREVELADSVLDAGVQVCLVTRRDPATLPRSDHENLRLVQLPAQVEGFERAIIEVLLPQLIAGHAARMLGRAPGVSSHHQPDTKLPPAA